MGIAMEFAAGGNMYEYLMKAGAWPEDIARWFFQQLIVGIDYMHRMVRRLFHQAAWQEPGVLFCTDHF